MCTIGYHKDLNLIFKNRDKRDAIAEEVIAEKDYIAVRTRGADYFSCGVNKYGCGFVSAAVNTPQWTSLIYSGEIRKANQQYKRENKSLQNPINLVSDMLPNARGVNSIIDKMVSSDLLWMGYNVLLADAEHAFVVETYGPNIFRRRLSRREAVTNHFLHLKHGPKQYSEYPCSFRRYEYGNDNIKRASSINDLFDMLKPTLEAETKEIWRGDVFKTISSSVIDLKKGSICYSNDLNKDYSVFVKKKSS